MMHMPAKPSIKPTSALREMAVLDRSKTMITSQRGNVAPMMEPNPAEIYFNPQVESVLLKVKLRRVNIRTVIHSLPRGIDLPFEMKKIT